MKQYEADIIAKALDTIISLLPFLVDDEGTKPDKDDDPLPVDIQKMFPNARDVTDEWFRNVARKDRGDLEVVWICDCGNRNEREWLRCNKCGCTRDPG